MPKNIKEFVLLYLICIFTSTTTFAKNVVVKENNNGNNNNTKTKQTKLFDNISFSLSTGITGIREEEYVFHRTVEDGIEYKASHLLWQINIPTVEGEVNFDINKYFSIGLNASKVFIDSLTSNGIIDDWDWEYQDDPIVPSDHSRGEFSVKDYYNIDFNIDLSLLLYKNFKLKGIVGYKYSYFDFQDGAAPTEYWYSVEGHGFYPLQIGLHYKQTYKVPYIGLKGIYNYNKWEFITLFAYSNSGKLEDMDHHLVSGHKTDSKYTKIDFYHIEANIGYYIRDNIKLFINFDYNKYKKQIANSMKQISNDGHIFTNDTIMINSDGHMITNYSGAANRNWSAKVGVEMKVR